MPTPRDVFDDPAAYWTFVTVSEDSAFEGQHFDRKEMGRPGTDGKLNRRELKRLRLDEVACTISAFANSNREGGLLVLGIATDGTVAGLEHLDEEQLNALGNPYDIVVGHSTSVRFHPCRNAHGRDDQICLVYVPYTERAICETFDHRAWERRGPQNVPVSPDRRDMLRREKGVLEYERQAVCMLNTDDLDRGILQEFRAGTFADSTFNRPDDELLRTVGASERHQRHGSEITVAGALFFLANPQRVMPWATIRLVRYGIPLAERDQKPLPDFDREISGPVTAQIRDFRALVRDAGFFKVYQRRRSDGGFADEPELPEIALDEAVVNAVAHRDYAIRLPIVCEKYTDAFVVRSPGEVRQPRDVPAKFTLADRQLESAPRNPFLMRWLRSMRDTHGKPYVQALAEGTRRMQADMSAIGLPAPIYELGDGLTTLTLLSDAPAREAALRHAGAGTASTEFANLFALSWMGGGAAVARRPPLEAWRRDFLEVLRERLETNGWYAEHGSKGRLTAHRRRDHVSAPSRVLEFVRLYPAYEFQVRQYGQRAYLCVDYTLTVQTVATVDKLLKIGVERADLVDARVVAKWGSSWIQGRLAEVGPEFCTVHLFGPEREEQVESSFVVPRLWRRVLDRVLSVSRIAYDLAGEIKKASLAVQPKAARFRSERTLKLVGHLAKAVFPLAVGEGTVALDPIPAPLLRAPEAADPLTMAVLSEPVVEFNDRRANANIREGITKFGAYDHQARDIELVPVCATPHRDRMVGLIERLRKGKMRYLGSERTFSSRLHYNTIITTPTEDVSAEVLRLLDHYPEWTGDPRIPRLFLVHTPEGGYALDDERAPYYQVKRQLLERGIPCQMIDTPTLLNPDYKDLNLALNITAKVGVAPWVLPGSIPDADFFIGLSYTNSARSGQERLMGFANVFNEYGRWEFYSGSGEAFPYDQRTEWYERLVSDTLQQLDHQLSETPRIYFHYSARFGRADRDAMLKAARTIRPRGTYTFVWINKHHPVRLYDARSEGDGSLARGSYVIGGRGQVYLSTTGFNPYRTVLGTPQALELNAQVSLPSGTTAAPDLRGLAAQILSLTKLNWASTDSLSAEPITTKYAGDIAYLTAAFLRQEGTPFRLHPVLERTPWFI